MEHSGFLSDQAAIAMVCGGYVRRALDPEVTRIIYFCVPSGKTLRPTVRIFSAFARDG